MGFARAFPFLFEGAFRTVGWCGKEVETATQADFVSPERGERGGEDRGEGRVEAPGEEC